MPTLQPPDNAFDRLQRALAPADAVNDPFGAHKMAISGTVNILGGGAGGTSTTDDSSYVPGSSGLTPAGGYYGGRQVGSGHVAAPALSGSAILQVDVVAGGAGGGAAQQQMRGTAGNWVDVGVASGAAGAAGNWALPVVYASGQYATVNIGNAHGIFGSVSMVGSVGVTPLATFTVALDKVATVNLGLGTVNIGNIPAVVGSVNVSAVGTFSVWVANAAAGGGFATVGIFGSASILGTVNVGGSIGAIGAGGSMGVVGAGGSLGVTQIGAPWSVVGSANVTPAASFTVNLASHIDTAGSAVRVNVVAGGAGGGVANITVRGTAGTNVYVGVASGAPGTDGAYALPVVYASGLYQTVNLGSGIVGSVGVSPLATFTVALDKVATVNLGLGTVNIGNIPSVVGSVNVTPVASFTINIASHIDTAGSAVRVNVVAGGAGGGLSQLQVQGTAGTYVNIGFASGAAGAAGNYALPIVYASGTYATVNLGAGVVGSVNVTPVASFTVNLASHIDTAGSAVRVNVVAGGAGGGNANIQVRGTAGTNVYVGVASGAPGTDGAYALPVVYASGLYPTVNLGAGVLGSVNVLNLGGSVGALGIGGSMGVTQIGAPWSVVGSMGVTPLASFTVNLGSIPAIVGSVNVTPVASFTVNLGTGIVGSVNVTPVASFTVNLGSIPTVNLGLGTVNIGSVVTATLPAVTVIDTRGSLTQTQWLISFGGSGYSAISVASLASSPKTQLYSIMVVATGTIDVTFQSPSGTFLTGSLRLLPGAGFAAQSLMGHPVMVGGANATLFIHATGTQNVGGWVNGWIAP